MQTSSSPEKLDHLSFRRHLSLPSLLVLDKSTKKSERPSLLENVEIYFDSKKHCLIKQDKQTR